MPSHDRTRRQKPTGTPDRSPQPEHPSKVVQPAMSPQHIHPTPPELTAHDIFQLQRMVGNQAVARLIKRATQGRQEQSADRHGPLADLQRVPIGPMLEASMSRGSGDGRQFAPSYAAGAPTHNVIQAKFWDSQWQLLSYQTLSERLSDHMELSESDQLALQGMIDEKVDYILPQDTGAYEQTIRPLIVAYQKQDKINVSKMIRIINSVLNHGILNQQDRLQMLNGGTRASTSTDSVAGSTNIHGMMLNNPEDKGTAAKTAERESVNVLAEVKDDILFSGVKKRLAQKLLMQEERQHAIFELQLSEELYRAFLGGRYDTLLQELQDHVNEAAPRVVDLISPTLKESVRDFALQEIAQSQRGWNELHKRMMSGFLTIYDAQQIPAQEWDIQPGAGQTGEGTVTASQPANRMLKLVLPKFLENYAERIINPHDIPIVYRSIEYPVEAEAHVYLPSGERVTFNNQINLRWSDEIQASLQEHTSVFTHMVRGF